MMHSLDAWRSFRSAAELLDDDRMPMSESQAEAEELYVREKMAVACEIARVVGHEMKPAAWDTWADEEPSLCAFCARCAASVSVEWVGDEWTMHLFDGLIPCHAKEEVR